ncbi:MAG TPA: hypothetical protein VMN58_01300 [Acidimicrobiales bacterium]|nr:hypothetical protein [Acidimicrobiales bacterium]
MLTLVTFPLVSAAPLQAAPARGEASGPRHHHDDGHPGEAKGQAKGHDKEDAEDGGPDKPGSRWVRTPSGYQSAGPDDDPDPGPPRGRESAPGQVDDKPQGGDHPDDGTPGPPGGDHPDVGTPGSPGGDQDADTPPATTPPGTTPPATVPPATIDEVAFPDPDASTTIELGTALQPRVVPSSTPERSVDLIRLSAIAPAGPVDPPAGTTPATPAVTPSALQAPFGPPIGRDDFGEVVTVTFPLTLAAIVLVFLLLHGRGDRRDPKLLEAPLDGGSDRVDFS